MSSTGTGTGQSPAWANAAQRSDGIPANVDAQLTEGERQALIAIRSKVRYAQRIGNVSGAALVYYWMHVRNRGKYSLASKVGFTIMGSLFAGGMAMPLGVMWGQSDVRSRVENQDHFKKVLENAARNKQANRSQSGVPPLPSQSSNTSTPNAPHSVPSSSSPQSPQQSTGPSGGTNKWGDESFDDSILYANNSNAASYDRPSAPMTPGNQSSSQAASSSSGPQIDAQTAQGNSRWAQLRGERGGNQQSSWDRVRTQTAQQQAQTSTSDQANATQRSNDRYDGYSSQAASNVNADPSFGKGINPQRAQAQRDYEASFERERRGVDG